MAHIVTRIATVRHMAKTSNQQVRHDAPDSNLVGSFTASREQVKMDHQTDNLLKPFIYLCNDMHSLREVVRSASNILTLLDIIILREETLAKPFIFKLTMETAPFHTRVCNENIETAR